MALSVCGTPKNGILFQRLISMATLRIHKAALVGAPEPSLLLRVDPTVPPS